MSSEDGTNSRATRIKDLASSFVMEFCVVCPQCNHEFEVSAAGEKLVTCPTCREVFKPSFIRVKNKKKPTNPSFRNE